MKRLILIASILLTFAGIASAQQKKDSVVFTPVSAVDSTLSGRSIFSTLPKNVTVNQSSGIKTAMDNRKAHNRGRMYNGYRIRIYFDNSQNARWASETAMNNFKSLYPGTSAYRSFQSPYFKVTVGDYRSRAEAQVALQSIKANFPSAFIVKEKFKYPALDNSASYKVDTVKVNN